LPKEDPVVPCHRKFLVSNTEFTKQPICTASRQYQKLKIEQIKNENYPTEVLDKKIKEITDKACLCTGLSAPAFINNGITPKHKLTTVAICPGPNLAYFSGTFSLKQMVDHIYGRINILNNVSRPNMFLNELRLYVDHLKKEIDKNISSLNNNKIRSLKNFQANLLEGINYYRKLSSTVAPEAVKLFQGMIHELNEWEKQVMNIPIPAPVTA
jgi:hypothetical protein